MKTPLTFYGGKQSLLPVLLSLIPRHTTYTEAFIGGGAVFWNKEPSAIEVINDTNGELINFYEVVQKDFEELHNLIQTSLYSRSQYNDAVVIYHNPHLFSRIMRAWAVWMLASQSFFGKFNGGWGYEKKRRTISGIIANRRDDFTREYALRLQSVQIECTDALRIIRSRDHAGAFHYCDPPYFNAECGHYNGYNQNDFASLLETLQSIQGKFLLSSYSSSILDEYTSNNNWSTRKLKKVIRISNGKGTAANRKIEVLTANFDINGTEIG